jgi:hypothetical protein
MSVMRIPSVPPTAGTADPAGVARDDTVTRQQILQFMTTEHFALQTAKSAIVAETSGRSVLYLSTVSSAVVALAFIGQVSRIGDAFLWFGLVLFPSLFFLGITTFVRLHQTSIESMMHGRRINRIRHYYVELAPELAPYFAHATHDDMVDFLEQMAIFVPERPPRLWGFWQRLLTIAGAVGVVNAVLAGVFIGMLVHAGVGLARAPSVAIGAVAFLAVVALHVRYQVTGYEQAERRLQTMFPNPTALDGTAVDPRDRPRAST